MSNDSREIVLAGNPYKITTPLTLGQLIDVNVGMSLPDVSDPAEQARVSFQRALNVLAAALAPEHPQLTVEALRTLRGATVKEFNAATQLVYELSGLLTKKPDADVGETTAPGEAVAEAQ